MATRKAQALWQGNLTEGKGSMTFGSYTGNFSAASRFEDGQGTNPEELLGAAHAGCFSMALSHMLNEAGYPPTQVQTVANVSLVKVDDGFKIDKIHLQSEATVPNIKEDEFKKHAEAAKSGCPVSAALAGPEITLDAKLVS